MSGLWVRSGEKECTLVISFPGTKWHVRHRQTVNMIDGQNPINLTGYNLKGAVGRF
jgi:hypothetical protein